MNRIKIGTGLIILSGIAGAQHFMPAIQIAQVRKTAKDLTEDEKKIECKNAGSNIHVRAFCDALRHLVAPDLMQVTFAAYAVRTDPVSQAAEKESVLSFLASVAESRLDTQTGASAGGAGTTSAVARSGISDVLGAALESGAVTQSISGTNLTLQGNALSLYRFVNQQEVFQYCPESYANCRGNLEGFLNMLSGSATLALSNASTQTATGTVTGNVSSSTSSTPVSAAALIQNSASHLTGFTVRFQPVNKLDLRSQAYLDAWKKAISDPSLTTLAESARADFEPTFKKIYTGTDPSNAKWLGDSMEMLRKMALANDKDDAFANAVAKQWDILIAAWPDNTNIASLKTFLQAANAYMSARDVAVNKARQTVASGLTFEYVFARPDNQPRTSTVRAIYAFHPGVIATDTATTAATAAGKKSSVKKTNDSAITLNFAAEMYDSPPPGTGVLRDLQAALQLDHHFGTAIATVAAYYQYQNQPAALQIGPGNLAPGTNIPLNGTAATLLAPKGNIVVAQAMITFPLKSGTKLPVGVTWSNRTELIKGNELRGHVGFNFDWSSLLLSGQAKAASPGTP